MKAPVIHRVTTLDLKVTAQPWAFARERRAEIDAHFVELRRKTPQLWNGQVLLARNPRFAPNRFSAEYFQTDFASFIAWRDWGHPDKEVFNGSGMGALRASDGAFVLGEMGPHTANAGRIYFAAGTPDPNDVRGGALDLPGSVAREVEEETGIKPSDYRAGDDWTCIDTGPAVSMIRKLDVDMPGEALRARIEANLAQQAQPELAAIHIVRTRRDISPSMPRYVVAFLEGELPA